jgi:methylated-DNA-[protein]-cysteine S-methyltransferase
MTPTSGKVGDPLRTRGLRSTPQRRAILAAFEGGVAEHLSADEVFARAAQALPDLSRGTVYATLAEFTEAGLLAAFGTPEPVRYETNTEQHAHFRCRLCLRIFDVILDLPDPGPVKRLGFNVERFDVRVEGTCSECEEYEKGLSAGARTIARSIRAPRVLDVAGAAALELDSALGPLLLAATSDGISRVAFVEHADFDRLRALAASRRGSQAAREHLARAVEQLAGYFAGSVHVPECEIAWSLVKGAAVLRATRAIPYAARRSYSELGIAQPARELGRILGANPIPLLTPCHRVTRGVELPTRYVGGSDRRRWLVEHESRHASRDADPAVV